MGLSGDQLCAEAAVRQATAESMRLREQLWDAARGGQEKQAAVQRTAHLGQFGMAMKELGWEKRNRRRDGAQLTAYVKGESERRIVAVETKPRRWALVYEDEQGFSVRDEDEEPVQS